MVLPAVVDVDRLVVDERHRGRPVDLADHLDGRALVDDHDVLLSAVAQRDLRRGVGLVRPVGAVAGAVHERRVLEDREDLLGLRAERGVLGGIERELEDRALEVLAGDERVVGVDQRGLDRRPERVLGVGDDVLVERARARDEDGERGAAAAAGAPHLLAQARERAGVAGDHGGVEAADVDAELEGVRGDDGAHRAVAEAGLDGAALLREVARPVAAHGLRRADPRVPRAEVLARVLREQLDALCASRRRRSSGRPRLAAARAPRWWRAARRGGCRAGGSRPGGCRARRGARRWARRCRRRGRPRGR